MSFVAVLRLILRWEPREDGQPVEVEVLYCDTCNRWGAIGSTHICSENWFQHVGDLLGEIAAEGA